MLRPLHRRQDLFVDQEARSSNSTATQKVCQIMEMFLSSSSCVVTDRLVDGCEMIHGSWTPTRCMRNMAGGYGCY